MHTSKLEPRLKKGLICFIHIEKAAGTTLHHILSRNFPNYLTISPTYYWSNEPGNYTNAKELAWLMRLTMPTNAVGGHPLRNYLSYEDSLGRPVKYITFLREPVSRYLSHFKHQKFAKQISWDIHSFLREQRFNNYMTCRISPTGNIDEAKQIVAEKMAFVGIMETFDESLLLMKDRLDLANFNPQYEKENVDRSRFSDHEIFNNPEIYQQIIYNNNHDIELYRFVKEELYPSYKQAYPRVLKRDLEDFRAQNKTFKNSTGFKTKTRLYRLLYYKPLQYLLKSLFH